MPAWLSAAADFDVLPLEEGSTVLPLHVQPLSKAAPEHFAQDDHFEQISSRSCLSLFEESLAVALRGDEESELFDQKLLQSYLSFSRCLGGGITSVEIESAETTTIGNRVAIRIEESQLEVLDRLIRKTPPSQRTRLVGKLDMIRHHDRRFSLQLDSGDSVQGIAEAVAVEDLRANFAKTVLVQGVATFRPSGKVLRVVADQIDPAPDAGSLWSQIPKPILGRLDRRALHQEQGARSGMNALFARWPGDETDREVAEVLAEIS